MLRTLAFIFGVAFIAIGIFGFVPSAFVDGNLFGLFHVNYIHNIVHLASGFVALWVGFTSSYASRLYFQFFGIIYGLVAVLGFIYGNEDILGLIANNTADTWLHLSISVIALYLGFGYNSKP